MYLILNVRKLKAAQAHLFVNMNFTTGSNSRYQLNNYCSGSFRITRTMQELKTRSQPNIISVDFSLK